MNNDDQDINSTDTDSSDVEIFNRADLLGGFTLRDRCLVHYIIA
jgi:hypothetical protein